MKKTISFILCIFVLLTFVSCGDKDDNNDINNANDRTNTTVNDVTDAPTEAQTEAPTVDRTNLRIAMFGDSLVAGLAGYGVTDRIDLFGSVCLSTQGVFDTKAQGGDIAIIDEIAGDQYDVIIIHLGINEVGNDTDSFISTYTKVIEGVRARAPYAEVWIHGNLPVSQGAEDSSQFGVTNAGISEKNDRLSLLAAELGCRFIDAGEIFRGDDGTLKSGVASDGIHPNKENCEIWANWIINKVTA